MVSTYELVKVPVQFFNKAFNEFNKKEATEYLNWTIAIKKERIDYLEKSVQHSNPEWEADYSRESLKALYSWFEKNVSFRLKTEDEYEADVSQLESTPLLKNVIEISDKTLDEKTVSLCFDIGLYFADCISYQLENTSWKYIEKPKNNAFYHQPVLTSKNAKVDLNPRNIMEVCARKILKNSTNKQSFIQLYDIWLNMLR